MLDNVFEDICSFDNLLDAFYTVSSEHKFKPASLRFYYHLEENLIELQNELLWGLYKLGDFYTFIRYEPKRREINGHREIMDKVQFSEYNSDNRTADHIPSGAPA